MDTTPPTEAPDQELAVQLIPLRDIHAENNDRKVFEEAPLRALAANIAAHGLIQPITVRPDPAGGYFLIAGERRFRASWLNGDDGVIRAFVVTDDDETASAKMLAENTAREDLNPIEEATAYQERIERFGWDVAKIAELAGKSVGHVEWTLQFLDLDDVVQLALAEGQTNGSDFGTGRATALMGLDHHRQRAAMKLSHRLNLQGFWNLCNRLRADQDQGSLFDGGAFALVAEEYVAAADGAVVYQGIKQLAGLVDRFIDGLDLESLIDGLDDPTVAEAKRRQLRQLRDNLDYRVRGVYPEGYDPKGSRTHATKDRAAA